MSDRLHNNDSPLPLTPVLLQQLGTLLSRAAEAGGMKPSDPDTHSPPEELLALGLDAALRPLLASGELTLERRVCLTAPHFSSSSYEVDFLITQTATGARGAVEVSAHQFHGRDRDRWICDLQRGRQLRRLMPLEQFSTSEILTNLWSAVGEIIDLLESWPNWAPLGMPATVRAEIRRWAALQDPLRDTCREAEIPADRIQKWERVRAQILALCDSKHQEAIGAAREHMKQPARAFAPWSAAELAWLKEGHQELDLEQLSHTFCRTKTAILRQLDRMNLRRAG